MTPQYKADQFLADFTTETRPTKKPANWLGLYQLLEQPFSYYDRPWPVSELSSEPIVHVGVTASKATWALVQEANLLAHEIPYADRVRSEELVRERLQQQLGALFGYPQGFDEIRQELTTLRQLLEALTDKVGRLTTDVIQTVCIPLRSFAPEPLEVAVPMDVVISCEEDGFQASFLDGNLHAYGETREEALSNIKAAILDTCRRLREVPDNQLGRSMLRQKQVLNHHLREEHSA
jgi:hypothetical protein